MRDLEQEARNRAEAQKRRRLLSVKYAQPRGLRVSGPVQQGRRGEVHGVLPFVSSVAGLRAGGAEPAIGTAIDEEVRRSSRLEAAGAAR